MRSIVLWSFLLLITAAQAHVNPDIAKIKKALGKPAVSFRENCDNAVGQIDQAINNVRARLLTGGDVWWDGTNARYVVPKVPPGVPEVSSVYAGSVWLGGVDPAGNLKLAAQAGGRASGDFDFYPGPLNPSTGKTEQETCAKWDRFFVVKGESIEEHLRNWEESKKLGIDYDPALIPEDVKGWPARGNEFFFDIHKFDLPNTTQGLAGFWDQDGDENYNPDRGDFPIIEIRGCTKPQFPDEMVFWIYNDAGNTHKETRGDPIQMEVQVQAFSYATNDELNNMTFQRYKLINRAIESIDSMFFAMWVDPDLGCFTDDYVGCDTSRSLAYVYNEDAFDGQTGCACPQGINTYCENIPLLGVDYFRGPLDSFGVELGMSSFTYYNNPGVTPTPPPGTTDPITAQEYYNYLSGSWRDGSPFTFGGDAYQDGRAVQYAFTDAPDVSEGWSMCTSDLPSGDRRTIQASGPFILKPGAINELIVGVVWVADQDYPCPSILKLQEADDVAQALFDNCFEITDGPDAPDVDFIELDREIIALFTNDTVTSNNAYEAYAQRGLQIPADQPDSLYEFEGYKLYQFSGPDVTLADLGNVDKVRQVAQVDLNNNITTVYNWSAVPNPTTDEVFVPEIRVEGTNNGIRHSFRITEDQFAEGDRRLINHKRYYFTAVAYAYNEYLPFDPKSKLGQRRPYLEGRRNIGDGDNPFYIVIPRPIVDRKLNALYGDGPEVTRIDGIGTGGRFLDISEETRTNMATGKFEGTITYEAGQGPIGVSIFNPLEVKDGVYEVRIVDANLNDNSLNQAAWWELHNISNPGTPVIRSESGIAKLNEQILKEYGFSITIGQVPNITQNLIGSNGLGYEEQYLSGNPVQWLTGVKDDTRLGIGSTIDNAIFDYLATGRTEVDFNLDPNGYFANLGNGYFVPFRLADGEPKNENDPEYITPAWTVTNQTYRETLREKQLSLDDLNNVDIVFTSNKDLWSRCVIVETANRYHLDQGFLTNGNRQNFDLRAGKNVTRDDLDNDGLPDIDTQDDEGDGMGWFPGYAVDVETGQRLNIFFGENSIYDGTFTPDDFVGGPRGNDMMFNPSDQIFLPFNRAPSIYNYYAGGQHFVYVTKQPYDECKDLRTRLRAGIIATSKIGVLRDVTWSGFLMAAAGTQMRSYKEGLIPADMVVKLRAGNPYAVFKGTNQQKGYPTYRFTITGKEPAELIGTGVDSALNLVNVVPNPYYGFSDYEVSQFVNTVKITNLPAKCVVTIYSLDGRFIRQYRRDELGSVPRGNNRAINRNQILPDLEWDLKNTKGIPIASGVYLIHVDAGESGSRTLKWFGINRKFDPSGL